MYYRYRKFNTNDFRVGRGTQKCISRQNVQFEIKKMLSVAFAEHLTARSKDYYDIRVLSPRKDHSMYAHFYEIFGTVAKIP